MNTLINSVLIGIVIAGLYIGAITLRDINDGRIQTVVGQLIGGDK